MNFYLLNVLGVSVFFIAEFNSEKNALSITLYEKKPPVKRGAFLHEHLQDGQHIEIGGWDTDTLWSVDTSNISFKMKAEQENVGPNVIIKLKMMNGTHVLEKD